MKVHHEMGQQERHIVAKIQIQFTNPDTDTFVPTPSCISFVVVVAVLWAMANQRTHSHFISSLAGHVHTHIWMRGYERYIYDSPSHDIYTRQAGKAAVCSFSSIKERKRQLFEECILQCIHISILHWFLLLLLLFCLLLVNCITQCAECWKFRFVGKCYREFGNNSSISSTR